MGATTSVIAGYPGLQLAPYIGKYPGVVPNGFTAAAGTYLDNTGAWSSPGGGGGIVTTFSATGLTPLFTTTVTNPTSTPALSFTAINAPANSVFGNSSGGPGVPGFQTTMDLVDSSSGSAGIILIQNPSTGTGASAFMGIANATHNLLLQTTSTLYSGSLLSNGPTGEGGFVYTNAAIPLTLGTNGDAGISISGTQALTFNAYTTAGVLTNAGTGVVSSLTGSSSTLRGYLGTGTASSSTYLRGDGTWATPSGGSGSVTSVGLTAPSIFTVSGSPVTTSGSLAFSLNNASANTVFAGPSSGGATTPTFRSLVAADISGIAVTSVGGATGAVTIANSTQVITNASGALSPTNGAFNVQAFGAVGNGSTDDTSNINNAIAALNSYLSSHGHGSLYFPGSIYLISSALTAIAVPSGGSAAIKGDGEAGTIINQSAAATAFTFTMAASSAWCEAHGLTISTSAAANTAIYVNYGSSSSSESIDACTFHDLNINTTGSGTWSYGILQNGGWKLRVNNLNGNNGLVEAIATLNTTTGANSLVAIIGCTNVQLSQIYGCGWGAGVCMLPISSDFALQGLMMTNCDFVGVNYAVYYNSSSITGAGVGDAPSVYLISNCQVDQGSGSGLPASSAAFYFDCSAGSGVGNRGQVTIYGCGLAGQGSNSPYAFYMKNVSQLTLEANTSYGNYGTFAELVKSSVSTFYTAIINMNHTAGGSVDPGSVGYNGTNYT